MTAPPAALRLLQLALAFALLNALLSFENRWPGFGVHLMPRLSFELCLAVAALAAWVAWRGVPSARAAGALSLGVVVLVAVRYADVTAPALLGRPVNVYWDGRHGLELLRVAAASQPGWRVAAAAAVFVGGLLLLVLLVRLAVGMLVRSLGALPARPLLLCTATLTAALSASWLAYVPDQRDTRWFFSLPLMPTLVQQTLLVARVLQPARGDAVLGPGPAFDGDLSALAGRHGPADVLLLFAESYGAVTLDVPALAAALAAPRAQLAQAIAAGGRGVVSARVRSPTFGGASWLAHASLLSGLPITDPGHHDLLLAGTRPTLVRHFAQHGYRTVGWMPGIKRPWPEGAFYGYARVADDAGIGYAGPDFGYWRIPDQAAMALLHAQELDRGAAVPDRAPRFAVFATASTHAPFHPLAPFVADWSRLTGAGAYAAADAGAALAAPLAVQQPLPNYVDSMRYQFTWLADYLGRHAPRPLVLVVIGDHQPPALVAGTGASWDVPVHVVSDDTALLARLQAQGFVDGLLPPATALGPMHALTRLLLQAFSSGPPAASVAVR
ncbi:hypothetical protein ACPOLB_24770 [Rubrivivax sp. RP6-9]|uniref:hypothetical protein n=1 Tax=Rubrivivax sp. RP6-9 TaxID=3415750 RepID=UPI003CC6BA9E